MKEQLRISNMIHVNKLQGLFHFHVPFYIMQEPSASSFFEFKSKLFLSETKKRRREEEAGREN